MPPQQNAPWTAKQGVEPTLVSATTTLFEQGLSDPRGGTYSEIEVVAGSVWGRSSVIKTHGWLLLAAPDASTRFAVCWNGLVYPVAKAGAAADLRADILAIVKADEVSRAAQAARDPKWPFHRLRRAWSEATSLSHQALLPLKAALLLRLGEAELADAIWTAWTAGMKANVNDDATHLKDPYLMLATDWAWALFDRAVCAHMRADDNLALQSCRALAPIREAVEAEAARRNFPRPYSEASNKRDAPYLAFLHPLPALLADQERRAKEAPAGPAPKMTDPKAVRIAYLVRNLENVAARQNGQPGGIDWSNDPIMRALGRAGEDALQPLLDAVKDGHKLTRSVGFGRDFFHGRDIETVKDAAGALLRGILRETYMSMSVSEVIASREQRKKVPPEERWFNALANDNFTPNQWLDAAHVIVQRTNVSGNANWFSIRPLKPGEVVPMRGEPLRATKNAELIALMTRRADYLANTGEAGSRRRFNLHDSCKMVLYLAEWDPVAALPALRTQIQRCRDAFKDKYNGNDWTNGILGRYIAHMTMARVRGQDAAALPEYSDWLRSISPQEIVDYPKEAMEPLWRYPDDAAMKTLAGQLFNGADSKWNPLPLSEGRPLLRYYVQSPLLGVTAFRQSLLRALGDKTPVSNATFTLDPPQQEPRVRPYRVCDLYAHELSWMDGTPQCELNWPEARRDEAVAACARVLQQYGERFKYSKEQEAVRGFFEVTHMTFPRRDRPATAAEVQNGTAIFSVRDASSARAIALPRFPVKARWTTLIKYPREVSYYDPKTNVSGTRTDYDQEGLVWQAEEVNENGRWQRYYGFVGRYEVARVPASEIEFLPPEPEFSWRSLEKNWTVLLNPPGRSHAGGVVNLTPLHANDRLFASVWLHNRLGLPQETPGQLRAAATGALQSGGIQLRLFYWPEITNPDEYADTVDLTTWQEVKPRTSTRIALDVPRRPIPAGEQVQLVAVDLKSLFEIRYPGFYRLQIITAGNSTAPPMIRQEPFRLLEDSSH